LKWSVTDNIPGAITDDHIIWNEVMT
jgi:hypothetical protein